MKYISLAVAIVLLAVGGFLMWHKQVPQSEPPTTPASLSKEYSNNTLNFAISFPTSWQVIDEVDGDFIFLKVHNDNLYGVDSRKPAWLGYAASVNYKTLVEVHFGAITRRGYSALLALQRILLV